MKPDATALSVNLNKVALVRNTRHLGIPSLMRAATACLDAGAAGITHTERCLLRPALGLGAALDRVHRPQAFHGVGGAPAAR